MTTITAPIFQNEDKARAYLEAQRWPDGPVCPFCGQLDSSKALPPQGSMGPGWYHCSDCRKKFTVRVGTLYERSHIPLHKWLLATHLLCASKKGMSAHQLARMLGVTYKSAWFMAHRIREGMSDKTPSPIGGEGKTVEADETYIGGKAGNRAFRRYPRRKEPVVSLIERGGQVRSKHVANVTAFNVRETVLRAADRKSALMTDQSNMYTKLGREFASHESVDHSKMEYVRGAAHTNTIENYFSILKRGVYGVYHHVSEAHLQAYLYEFDFRHNNRIALGVSDTERMDKALKGIEGKRLTYRRTGQAAHA